MNWPIQKRLKRVSVAPLTYDESDLAHYGMLVALFRDEIVGIAAWEADVKRDQAAESGGLFHGLFVLPVLQRQGIGRALMDAVFSQAREQGVPGLLFKAQRVSRSYFEHLSFEAVAVNDSEYPWQYWKRLA